MKFGCVGCGGLVVLLLLLAAVGAMLGPSQGSGVTVAGQSASQPAAKADQTAAIGQTVKAGNWEYTVLSAERRKEFVWSEFGNKSTAKGTWQIVRLRLKNVAQQTYPINAHDFEIHDSAGVKYTADLMHSIEYAQGSKIANVGDTFPPGVDSETAIVADVNPGANGFRLYLVQARTYIKLD